MRGVHYYGLTEACPQKCADGPWSSAIFLIGDDSADWAEVAKAERTAEAEGKKGKRLKIRVTVVGRLDTIAHHSLSVQLRGQQKQGGHALEATRRTAHRTHYTAEPEAVVSLRMSSAAGTRCVM